MGKIAQQLAIVVALCSIAISISISSASTLSDRRVNGTKEVLQLPKELQQLTEHNFLVGIAMVGARHENGSSECGRELGALLRAVADEQLWSLKVIDSFGHAPQSFTWGNYFWFASGDLCDELNEPYHMSLAKPVPDIVHARSPFPMRYSVVYMNFSTPHFIDVQFSFNYVLHVGLCLPSSCSLESLTRYTQIYFESNTFQMQRKFQIQMKTVDARTPEFSWSIFESTGSVLIIVIFCVVILLMILAELVHRSQMKLKQQQLLHTKIIILEQQPPPSQQQHEEQKQTVSSWEKYLLCFRFSDNYKRTIELLPVQQHKLAAIAGFRSIICLWVTVLHVYYFALFTISNASLLFAKQEHIAYQPIMQGIYYVDIFFVISAFLLVYNFLSNEAQMRRIRENNLLANLKHFGKAVLRRYLRLTPVMILSMLFTNFIYDFINSYSPYHLDEHSGLYCKTNWWYNLVYIQNFFEMRGICCSWSWYLACEMQYFVLFTALLYVMAKCPNAAKIIFATLTLGFAVTSWLCNYQHGISFQIDVIYKTLDTLYVKPWVRINPYIGGAICGWLLHYVEKQQQRQQSTKNRYAVWRAVFWLLCATVYIGTNLMTYWRTTPVWLVATIMSVGKLLFAVCVGLVIVLCVRRHGGPVQWLLSVRVFLFLEKFCFATYMLAPVLIVCIFAIRQEATKFIEIDSGCDFIALVALSLIFAFMAYLLYELPIQRVSNAFLRPQKEQSTKRQQQQEQQQNGEQQQQQHQHTNGTSMKCETLDVQIIKPKTKSTSVTNT